MLDGSLSSRTRSGKRDVEVPIRISFAPTMNTGRLDAKHEVLAIRGKTRDLSLGGVAFLVDSIRLREHYLVGEDRVLDAELTLPDGKVKMKLVGQRYEQFGKHLSINTYLIGAKIMSIDSTDEEIYRDYLKPGRRKRAKMQSVFEADAPNQ
jgi:hypothetical protein